MARDGSGTFTKVGGDAVFDTVISETYFNTMIDDIQDEITNSVAVDGQSTLTGTLKAANGTVSLPGLTFGADPDSGIYRIGANNIGIGVNGALVLDIGTAGATITGTLGIGAITTSGDLTFSNATPEIIGGDTDGELYISPGVSKILGGNIVLYGDTHATQAGDYEFRDDAGIVYAYDASATNHLFTGNVQVTGAIRVNTSTGAAALDEASSATNPTLIPDRSELGTGIGGTANNVSIIAEGAEVATGSTAGLTLALPLIGAAKVASDLEMKDTAETVVAKGNFGATPAFDVSAGNVQWGTVDQNVTSSTMTDWPADTKSGHLELEVINGGAFSIVWPTSVDWVGGTAPTLTTSGTDKLIFKSRDAGTTVLGFVAGLDVK